MKGFFRAFPLFPLEGKCPKGRRVLLITLLLFFCFSFVINGQTDFQKGEVLFKQEKFIQARPIFENHLKQYPKDKQTLEYMGDIAGHSKDWDKAILYYEALVKEEPSNANYHYKYGGVLGMKALSINKLLAAPI